jgi:hypothetical protein
MPRPALATPIDRQQRDGAHAAAAAHLRVLRAWIRLVENPDLRFAEGLHRASQDAWLRHCLRHLTPVQGTP